MRGLESRRSGGKKRERMGGEGTGSVGREARGL